jgi:hypothetical protein
MNNKLYTPETSDSTLLRRSENRFNYAMELSVRTKLERFTATTIDVSSKGMKFVTSYKPHVNVVDFLYIHIPELNTYLDSFVADKNVKTKTREPLTYEIVYIEVHETNTIIACQYIGHFYSDLLKLESYIEDKLQSYQIDLSHKLHNIQYNYYEHLCFNNISQWLYYFLPASETCLFVESENNRVLYDFVTGKRNSNSKADLSAFISLQSLHDIVKQSAPDIDFYLFIFWEDNKLSYRYSFELKGKQALTKVLQQTVKNKGFILKGYCNKISLSQFSHKKEIASLPLNAEQAIHQIVFYDISNFVNEYFLDIYELSTASTTTFAPIIRGIVKNCYYKYFLYNSDSQRLEKRHLFKTEVVVRFSNTEKVKAETIDFSYSGISVILDKHYSSLLLDSTLAVDFSVLVKKFKGLKLINIPFTIKNISLNPFNKRTTLGLMRKTSLCDEKVNQFFDIMVNKNHLNLPVCKQDRLSYLEKQFIQKHHKENLRSIPIFLNSKGNDLSIKEVKTYSVNCVLAQFFYINNKFDFSCLTRQFLLKSYADFIKLEEKQNSPFLAFFIKMNDRIKIITHIEITQNNKLKQIAKDTIKRNGLCVLIKFHKNDHFDEQAFEMACQMDNYSELEETASIKEKVKDICGYMELIDISSFFKLYQ